MLKSKHRLIERGKVMSEIMKIINEIRGECFCGRYHDTSVKDIRIGEGLVCKVGEILKENYFPQRLLVVGDNNTLPEVIFHSLANEGFEFEVLKYENLRLATMAEVDEIEALITGRDIGVLSVGTGSINDPCRLAAARADKPLCIFATAPSMDGFASCSSPIVKDGFKASYSAKSPELIIADTDILASSPIELKSAGFGDMISKYTALIDWQVASLLTDEPYCEKVAALTRAAVDELMEMADKVTFNDKETAGKIFESLLKTGIGMSFMQNPRPASGAEHIIGHLIECVELRDGIIPNYHGEDIGVCTLYTLKLYNELAELERIETKKENVDWDDVLSFYGSMADDVRKLNFPDNIIDKVDPDDLKNKWGKIREIIRGVPSYEECKEAMRKAGCKLEISDIGKSEKLFYDCAKYSPYMRKRLTLLRVLGMIEK